MHVSQCASNLGTGRAQTGEIFLSCHIHVGLLSGHAEGVGEVARLHPTKEFTRIRIHLAVHAYTSLSSHGQKKKRGI